MNPAIMPTLTANNNSPLLWKAVSAIKESGIDIHRVRFLLVRPEFAANELREIFHQKPVGNVAVTTETAIEVTVNPGTGYFVDTKEEWYRMVGEGKMTIEEASDRLKRLGEIQLLLRSPPVLVNALLFHCRASDAPYFQSGLNFSQIFSDSEIMTLATLYPFKRNSHLPTILSQMFTQVLSIDFQFMQTLNDHFPQILSVRVSCTHEVFRKYQDKVFALEELLIPVTCKPIYLFQFPVTILNGQDAFLDHVQLG